jgi:hypothetical protein
MFGHYDNSSARDPRFYADIVDNQGTFAQRPIHTMLFQPNTVYNILIFLRMSSLLQINFLRAL